MAKLIRFAFFLLYNQLAFTYDWVAWTVSLGHWSRWRKTALPYLISGPTLELAYGTGGLFVTMAQAGLEPVGIDLSPFMAKITAQRLRHRGLHTSVSRAKAQRLPFPAAHFANIVATFPTPYIFDPRTLAEVRRVLRPETGTGRLIVVLQGELVGLGPLSAFIEWLYRITGQRALAEQDVLGRFANAGFEARLQRATFKHATVKLIVAEPASSLKH